MNKPSIVFRADGNSEIGLGHLVRSSALAAMLKENYHCLLATRCQSQALLDELKCSFSQIFSLPDGSDLSEEVWFDNEVSNESLVVLDGYNFDDQYQEVLIKRGFDLFCIDDIHAFPFYSRAVINHSGGLTATDYHSLPSTQFYLGPHYSLLRKPFLDAAAKRRNAIADKNIFICFGGADPENQTAAVLKELTLQNSFHHFHVVVGSAYQFKAELEADTKRLNNITLYSSISPREMVSVMQQCSYAICSPSTIMYEYLSVGGIVFLEQIADNQKDVIRYFTTEGMAFRLNEMNSISEKQIEDSFAKQAFYFDGKSGQRFEKIFRQYFEGKKLAVRKVNEGDMRLCYEWANDPEVRAQSYNPKLITFEEHTAWFQKKLHDNESYFYILESDRKPVAQIRFQVSGGEAVLGFLAGPSIRSKGLGPTILGKGVEAFVNEHHGSVNIIGYVKKSNIPSQRSFERLSFIKEETTDFPDSFKYTMNYGN